MALSKEQALEAIRQFAKEADISIDEIATVVGDVPTPAEGPVQVAPSVVAVPVKAEPTGLRSLSMTEVLSYIGAVIVVIGLSFLIGQNWAYLGTVSRLILTLGVGAGFYGTATYLMAKGQYERAANAFQVIAAYALSVGAGVLLYTLHTLDNKWAWAVMATLLTALYVASDYKLRRVVLSFFTVFFATILFWTVIIASNVLYLYSSSNVFAYASIIVGVSYLALAYAWQGTWRKILKGALATFGAMFILGGVYALSNASKNPTAIIWTLLLPGILAVILYGSTKLRSGGMFLIAVIWLVVYIFTITGRYFATSFSWPIALMFAGLILIAVGYFAVGFKNKYLKR